jgi:hypothetical protein
MCSHYVSAQDLVSDITERIHSQIELMFESLEDLSLPILFDVKLEFGSLKTYEEKLVFPEILKVFNTKNKDYKSNANIQELILLTQKKDAIILEYLNLITSNEGMMDHRLHELITYFQEEYFPIKKQWYDMLDYLSKTCTCFIKIADTSKD